jgi:TusA-related sulfurtransferase
MELDEMKVGEVLEVLADDPSLMRAQNLILVSIKKIVVKRD